MYSLFIDCYECITITGHAFDCNLDCFRAYQLGQEPVTSCKVVSDAINCYWENRCYLAFSVDTLFLLANDDATRLNCTAEPEENPSEPSEQTPLPPTISPCPILPSVALTDKPVAMPSPDVNLPSGLPKACAAPETHTIGQWNQCSFFMDSQLRAFSSYRQGLETCSIPGKWYMLQHPSLSIEVEGTNMTGMDSSLTHTRLSKITVSISPNNCDPVRRTYVAQGSQPLSAQLTPPPSSEDVLNPTRLMCDANGTVVTLLVPWLNTAIMIRQYAGFLSITIKVPSQIASESEGLCTGCPARMYINITRFNNQFPSRCSDAQSKAMRGCFVRGGVVEKKHLTEVTNNTYLDVCLFNMYKTGTLEVLTMLSAITDDAKTITELPELLSPSTPSTPSTRQSTSSSLHKTQTSSTTPSLDSHSRMLNSCGKLVALLASLLFLLLR